MACPCCDKLSELDERVKALQEALDWEKQRRECAEQERDKALEDLCELQQATKGTHGPV